MKPIIAAMLVAILVTGAEAEDEADWHPDGGSIVFTAVEASADQLWALENFLPARIAKR